jgi:hypothetical protein
VARRDDRTEIAVQRRRDRDRADVPGRRVDGHGRQHRDAEAVLHRFDEVLLVLTAGPGIYARRMRHLRGRP